ncbi:uncharacterized protein LOC106152312 [Lingula anatina]|uniref:Uncharacterized protein LOC106152312 n=1 Tax=Lingula anatina TaxID=7574 RepID=A0A1S3H839_LINAN|nr:uncharacterized protein LOC106152312 [Lingula anatina]XP_013381290.1 uncharacterized protein LOC106152312 [Lingula anatina]XP_013381291.1 uncharacterized protein LOC106152312 [Lingula anatina]|eukprot:XP_013381289.1 uncharacterized protein LOC106152312 [Lingula anatina]
MSTKTRPGMGAGRSTSIPLVTEEARRVLEHMLQRNLRTSAPPTPMKQKIIEVEVREEERQQWKRQSYCLASEDQVIDDIENGTYKYRPPVRKAHTVSSSDFNANLREKIRNSRGSSIEMDLDVLENDHTSMQRLTATSTHEQKSTSPSPRKDTDFESSSETSDATSVASKKKKKSPFKRATERLRETFRRKKKDNFKNKELSKSAEISRVELNAERIEKNKAKKEKKNKPKKSSRWSLRKRDSVDSVKSSQAVDLGSTLDSLKSRSTLSSFELLDKDDILSEKHTHTKTHYHQELTPSSQSQLTNKSGSLSSGVILRTENTQQVTDVNDMEHGTKMHKEKTSKVKESSGAFDNVLKQMKKSSSSLKRKFSKSEKRKKSSSGTTPQTPSNSAAVAVFHNLPYVASNVEVDGSDKRKVTRVFQQVLERQDSLDDVDGLTMSQMGIDSSQGSTMPVSPMGPPADRSQLQLHGLSCHRPCSQYENCEVEIDCDTTERKVRHPDGTVENIVSHKCQRHHLTLQSSVVEDGLVTPGISDDGTAHHDRTHEQKEEMYEKIAQKLAAIADSFVESESTQSDKESPRDRVDSGFGGSGEGATAAAPHSHEPSSLELHLGQCLKCHGDRINAQMSYATTQAFSSTVAAIIHHASYNSFKQTLTGYIGSKPEVQQIALLFQITKAAVNAVGAGGAMALQIKEMSLAYFTDKFAGWLVDKGGWDSVMEETDSELD